MRGFAVVVAWASLSACVAKSGEPGDNTHEAAAELAPAQPPSAPSPSPAQHTHTPASGPGGPDDLGPKAIEYQVPPLLDSGVPAVSRGPQIRLPSLEVGTRVVGELEVPTVAITDPQSRAALDELLLDHAKYGRCTVMLALETFVSVRCAEVRVNIDMDSGQRDHHIAHFELGPGGDVKAAEVWTLFHRGEEPFGMTRRLVHDPGAGARRVVATAHGIELSYPFDGKTEIDLLPWRSIAPYIRVDGPLGPALVAEGLPLAPAGTKLPIAPVSPALWADSEQTLLGIWASAPPQIRAHARLVTTGGHNGAGLVFAPDIGAGEVAKLESALVDRGVGFHTELVALVVAVRTREVGQLREQPGLDDAVNPVIQVIPAQTVLTSVDGLVHRLDSAPGTQGWAYVVVSGGGGAGWMHADNLEVLGPSHGVTSDDLVGAVVE